MRLAGDAGLLLGLHGWGTVVRETLGAIVIGGLAAVVLLAAGRRRTSDLPFGPAIALGAIIAVGE